MSQTTESTPKTTTTKTIKTPITRPSHIKEPERNVTHEIAPRSGTAFLLHAGEELTVIDPKGGQVSDLLAFNAEDINEVLSSGRSLDYASTLFLTTGHILYSNRSSPLLTITHDTCGRHDFLLTPCSADTFRILYNDTSPNPPRGCFGNLAEALGKYGIKEDRIPTAFNCFMNTVVDGETGELRVEAPRSKEGDRVVFRAEKELVMGLTACSAGLSCGGSFKSVEFRIE